MRFSVIVGLLLLTGCKHFGLSFEAPGILKAVVEGEIKGMLIHCEKTITLGTKAWEVMCKVNDEVDIKYRTQKINSKQIKLEMLIDKQVGDSKKVIAAPVMIVNKNQSASVEMVSDKGRIDIRAESINE
jgi:hypothetical protein